VKSLLKQFGHPSGGWGRVAGWVMARTNRRLNAWTVRQMDLRPGERILEVGFGPGLALRMIAEKNPQVLVDGIDFSLVMVRQAGRRNAWAIRQGQVAIRYGTVADLPYRAAIFDKAFAVNNIREWSDPALGLKEVWRVLKPGGVVAITMQQQSPESDEDFADLVDRIRESVRRAGFDEVRLEQNTGKPDAVCLLAKKQEDRSS
jgi:ubiquinone/menaquinone biosynthesis C-methylase UbiE